MNATQQEKVQDLAVRFGCWPDDVQCNDRGELVDVVIGQSKGRPKSFTVAPNGRVLSPSEA